MSKASGNKSVEIQDFSLKNAMAILEKIKEEKEDNNWKYIISLHDTLQCPVSYSVTVNSVLLRCGHRLSQYALNNLESKLCPVCRVTIYEKHGYSKWYSVVKGFNILYNNISQSHKSNCFIRYTTTKSKEKSVDDIVCNIPEFYSLSKESQLIILNSMGYDTNIPKKIFDTDEKWIPNHALNRVDIFDDKDNIPAVGEKV